MLNSPEHVVDDILDSGGATRSGIDAPERQTVQQKAHTQRKVQSKRILMERQGIPAEKLTDETMEAYVAARKAAQKAARKKALGTGKLTKWTKVTKEDRFYLTSLEEVNAYNEEMNKWFAKFVKDTWDETATPVRWKRIEFKRDPKSTYVDRPEAVAPNVENRLKLIKMKIDRAKKSLTEAERKSIYEQIEAEYLEDFGLIHGKDNLMQRYRPNKMKTDVFIEMGASMFPPNLTQKGLDRMVKRAYEYLYENGYSKANLRESVNLVSKDIREEYIVGMAEWVKQGKPNILELYDEMYGIIDSYVDGGYVHPKPAQSYKNGGYVCA